MPLSPSAHGFVRPTPSTLFWRTFVPWQLLRFVIINLRMTAMILKSHQVSRTPGRKALAPAHP
jgi:hypothetical protein